MQTTVQEESKNVKDVKSTIELELPEKAQDIKRKSIAMRRDSSLAAKSQLSVGKLYSFHLTPL